MPGFVDSSPTLDNWSLGQSSIDPLQNKADRLVAFCFPNASSLAPGTHEEYAYNALKTFLSAENMKSFLFEYRHYHSHWPLLHIQTLDPSTANDSLVLALCCVGAVYSDRLTEKDVRFLMDIVRPAVLRSSKLYQLGQAMQQTPVPTQDPSVCIEEIQAFVLIHSVFLWHASPAQRQNARESFWILANVTRCARLLRPMPRESPGSSALHQPGPVTGEEVNTWDWKSWIENEKRTRLMAYLFLCDAASTIFFNTQPQFDVFDIQVALPADDAAWEAGTAEECASALGLRGQAAQSKNETGSRRAKQLHMSEALHVLYGAGPGAFPERATNAFGKFILIHALHVQIYNIQRQLISRPPVSGASTPESPATPPNGLSERTHQLLRSTVNALEMWKQCWDTDLAMQFPNHQRRYGYCRDGIHYYYLARAFLRNSRPQDWATTPEVRCRQVFHLMKQVRAYVASDAAHKGIDVGSVNAVADDYAIVDLTLNMRRLFRPINDEWTSPTSQPAYPQRQ